MYCHSIVPVHAGFCALKSDITMESARASFSPDGKYIVLQSILAVHFPTAIIQSTRFLETLRTTRPVFYLLSLVTCKRIEEFSRVSFTFPGRFSEGGDCYELVNPGIHLGGKPYDPGKRFHLEKRTWEIDKRQDN